MIANPKPAAHLLNAQQTMSLAKQNFSNTAEEAINAQINMELQASMVYLSMAAWASNASVALPGKKAAVLAPHPLGIVSRSH